MQSWLTKVFKNATQSHNIPNSQGTDDGGLGIGGKLFPGQAQLFAPQQCKKKRKRDGINKKEQSNHRERPGEPKIIEMFQMR